MIFSIIFGIDFYFCDVQYLAMRVPSGPSEFYGLVGPPMSEHGHRRW
jgi:hypothetical protein